MLAQDSEVADLFIFLSFRFLLGCSERGISLASNWYEERSIGPCKGALYKAFKDLADTFLFWPVSCSTEFTQTCSNGNQCAATAPTALHQLVALI